MGRETRILLGLLGLLAGLFVGVVSLKLLVPRPPVGAGPDVHGDVAFTVRQELVPPPVRGPRAADFAAAPPLVATVPSPAPFAGPSPSRFPDALGDPVASSPDDPDVPHLASQSGLGLAPSAHDAAPLDASPATVDPFVRRTAFVAEAPDRQEPATDGSRFARPAVDDGVAEPGVPTAPPVDEPDDAVPANRFALGLGDGPGAGDPSFNRENVPTSDGLVPSDPIAAQVTADDRVAPPGVTSRPAASPGSATTPWDARLRPAAGPIAGGHVVAAGDSWWSLAERAYGDGRLYRALYAWNRSRNPRVALVPGTSLEVPPVERLAASWPGLLPASR